MKTHNTHPITKAPLLMRNDYFQMSFSDFMIKYMNEPTKDTLPILLDLWEGTEIEIKFEVINLMSIGRHWSDHFHNLLNLSETFGCKLMESAASRAYFYITGRTWGDEQ